MSEENKDIKGKTRFLLDVLNRYDHYIGTTNFKIGLMMSFLGAIILGLTIRVILLGPTQGDMGCIRLLLIITSLLTILSALFAAFRILGAVSPNTNNDNGSGSLVFFGTIVSENRNPDEYHIKVKSIDQEALLKDLATQTYNVAKVVNEKFRIIKAAVNIMRFFTIPFLTLSLVLMIFEGM